MKEFYVSPNLHVVCFVPVERLASTSHFDELLNMGKPGLGEAVVPSEDDIPLEIRL